MELLKNHGNGIALVYARTETKFFFDHIWNDADALFFFKGRLLFYHVDVCTSGIWQEKRNRTTEISVGRKVHPTQITS
jgi:hypothetical protein